MLLIPHVCLIPATTAVQFAGAGAGPASVLARFVARPTPPPKTLRAGPPLLPGVAAASVCRQPGWLSVKVPRELVNVARRSG